MVPATPRPSGTVAWATVQGLATIANAGMLDDAAVDDLVAGAVQRLVLGLRPRWTSSGLEHDAQPVGRAQLLRSARAAQHHGVEAGPFGGSGRRRASTRH